MTVCPWCKARNPSSSKVCFKCGKAAADHPSVTGRTVGDDFGDDEIADVPALDLDISTSRATPGTPTNQPLGREVGDGFGDDDEGDHPPHAALDLDLRAPGSEAPPPMPKEEEPKKKREIVTVQRPSEAIEIDPYEVKILADYGAEPKSIVETIPYALRVMKRQHELKKALERVRASIKEAEARRDERLVELGTLLRPVIAGNPDFASFGATIQQAEKTVEDREKALAETNAAFRDKAAGLDAEIAGFEPQLNAARTEVAAKAKAHDDAELLRKKHEARRKRVEIDVRAAQAKLAALDTPAPDRAQAQALIAAANQERETRAAEEKIATQAAQRAEGELATARATLDRVETQVEALRTRRRALEQEFSRAGAVRSEGVQAASKELRVVLLEIGRKTWQGGPDAPGADMRRKGVADAMAQVKKLQLDLEKHVRALGVADQNSVRKGLAILGAAVVLVLGLFVAWRALRSNPYLPPDQQPKSMIVHPSHRA